ncbi:MAG TPA: hypothetical protein VMG37_19620 [Solirubrobacteraceae bacterium]|nr:hypothetical protein [Solirubrobacteraceae bacterium]
MRRMRVAAAGVLLVCGLLALAITSASHPAPASAAAAAPTVTTGSPSSVGQSSATASGTVNPNGQSTSYYFKYGTTTSYGLQTTPAGAGSGTGTVAVHQALDGLSPNTTYHYQLVATSSAGTTNGTDQTFTTSSTATSQTVVLGHEGFVSPGSIVGAEVGCFHGSTTCTGQLTMSHDGTTIAQRSYSIAPDSGGFQNVELNSTGQNELKSNGVFHLLAVTVTTAQTGGQTSSWVIHLARWVWH